MTWYAASIIICIKLKTGKQESFPVYENVILVEGKTPEEAKQKAIMIGHEEESLDDGLRLDDKPATRYFVGIRKLINISNPVTVDDLDETPPISGTEITYSLFNLKTLEEVENLAKGAEVNVHYIE